MDEIKNLGVAGSQPAQTTPSVPQQLPSKMAKPIKPKSKAVSILITVFSVLVIFVAITAALGFFLVYVPGKKLYQEVNAAKAVAIELKQAASEKDLAQSKEKITALRKQINTIEADYKKFALFGSLPVAKDYYKDGQLLLTIAKDGLDTGDILIQAVEPYQDFLGLKGSTKTDSAQTTEDRIAFLTQSVEGLVPHLDSIDKKVAAIESNLNQIDPNRYPEEYDGLPIRSSISKAKETVADAHKLLRDGQPILKNISWLLGKDKTRNYLLLFQNDLELRPTGGFWTAYGTLSINNGKISPGTSNNIYDLDDKINSKIPAPRVIKNYHIGVNYLNVRDMNISPDFPTSAQEFLKYYYQAYGEKTKMDAVIGLDTSVLVELVKVLGKVDTPLGKFTTEPDKRCNGCPQILYELEWMAGRPRNYIEKDRKGFLGPLMHSLLANAMGSEKGKIAPLAQAGLNSIFQKHVLFYFTKPEIQEAAVLANIAGSIVQTDQNTDYFALVDSNMASAKSNLFIETAVKHEISTKNNQVEHKVTVTYENPFPASNCNLEKGDLCLNASQYRNFYRFYVPQGSKLNGKISGSEVEVAPYEELGKTIFEGFYGNKFPLYAKSSSKVSVSYVSTVKPSANYTLYLQKQAGTKPYNYEIYLNGKKVDSFSWVSDKTVKLSL